MNRTAYADKHHDRSAAGLSRRLALVLLVLIAAGCTAPTATREPSPAAVAGAGEYRSTGIRIRLTNALRAGDRGTLLEGPGWVEYVFAIDNTGSAYLPDLAADQAKALVISYGHDDQTKRLEIRLSRRGA